jgi:hypothetical protein
MLGFIADRYQIVGSQLTRRGGAQRQLVSQVFASCSGLVKRRVPVDVSKIVTNMVWHVRTDKNRKHMWLRQQIKAVYEGF